MEMKRMKIVEFDDEGRPVERQGPTASPRMTSECSGPVRIVAFGDEPEDNLGVETAPDAPKIKIREFDGAGAPRPAGEPMRFRIPSEKSIRVVEFDDDGKPRRRENGSGARGIKIVEFD